MQIQPLSKNMIHQFVPLTQFEDGRKLAMGCRLEIEKGIWRKYTGDKGSNSSIPTLIIFLECFQTEYFALPFVLYGRNMGCT